MDQNHIIKISSRKSKDYPYKYNSSNYHIKSKTETNLYEENQKLKNKMNLKSLRMQSSKISIIPENTSQKNIKKINSVRPLTSSSYSKLDIISKPKNTNYKNYFKNSPNHQPLNLQNNNNKQYINIHNNKISTLSYEDKDLAIKKNKSNTSLSNEQQFKNKSIDYQKNPIIKTNQQNEFLDLKIIKKEKKIILNKLNSSKCNSQFIKQYCKDPINPSKLDNYYNLNSYSSKINDYLFDNSEFKNASLSLSCGLNNNFHSFSEHNKNLPKFNSFNSSISPSNIIEKRNNRKAAVFGQYYIDIDLSLNDNIPKDKNNLLNKRLLKKAINLDNSIQKDSKINAKINLYNSPLEKSKKSNSKNIIDLRNNFNFNYLGKKYNFTSREKMPNIINAQTKKVEYTNNIKNKTAKNKVIPNSNNKKIPFNDYQNQYLSNHSNINNSFKKKRNNNIVDSKLKKNNIISQRDLFFSHDSKTSKDYINFQKKIKNNPLLPKNKEDNNNNFFTEQVPVNYINLNSNYLTENKIRKNNRTENLEFTFLSSNMKNINKRNITSQPNILFSKQEKEKLLEDLKSIDNNDLKISVVSTTRKNYQDKYKRISKNKETNSSELNNINNIHEAANNNITDFKTKKNKYFDSNLKYMNLIESVNNLDNNCFISNFNNIANRAVKPNNKNINGMQICVSNTDSGKKKISISPLNNKLNFFQNNGINKKINNKFNINIDEYNSKSFLINKELKNKITNKIINYTDYNKELLKNYNNNKRETYTLLKSISFCKQINNPVKLYPKKKESKLNKAFYNPSYVRKIYIPNQNNNNNNKYKKFNNTVEIQQNNRINNSLSNNYKKYKNNNNIININNNTSNVNVLNVKNSSINICFEKKEKYKDLSPEKNINYSTTVNSIHRNNKINIKNDKNINYYNNKKKNNINENKIVSYIKKSPKLNKYKSNINIKRNDYKLTLNGKKGFFEIKNNTQQLSMNNSQISLFNDIKINKGLSERDNNIKINLNDFKNEIEMNKISLNTARNSNIYNSENILKQKKEEIFKEKNNLKKNLHILSANNSIIVLNKKCLYGVYIKPTLSKSKSKKNSQSEIKLKKEKNNINKIINTPRFINKLSKSLNPEKRLETSPPKIPFKSKYNIALKLSNTKLKSCKSARNLHKTFIDKKSNRIIKKNLDFYFLNKNVKKTTKLKKAFENNNCFINKFYNYFLKLPKIDNSYYIKRYISKNLNKEKTIKMKSLDSNNTEDNFNFENNKFFKSIEKMNKNELINDENIEKKIMRLSNEDEKINESSQNGLIMTFGEVNYTKKNSEKINTANFKSNEIFTHFNNDVNESDLDMYKNLNIIQQEPELKNEDNITENEDIKLYFSDEDEIGEREKTPKPLYNSNKINNNDLLFFYGTTNGKEIEDMDKKVCKTFKKTNKGEIFNLEKAEKGLRILKKIVFRRGYKSDDEQIKNNKNEEVDENNHKIFLGTNKLNELFNNRKERDLSYNKKKNYNAKYLNKYSKSVNKDILKGIFKIENFFEKKYLNDNTKINTYEGKNNLNNNYDFSEDISGNIDNIMDYEDDVRPKIRTYVQKLHNNLYFSTSKAEKVSNEDDYQNNDDDYVNLSDIEMKNDNFKKHEKTIEDNFDNKESKNNKHKSDNKIPNVNQFFFSDNEINNEKEIINNKLSLKDNMIKELSQKNNINDNYKSFNDILINTNLIKPTIKEESKNIITFEYLENLKKYQSQNTIKHDIIFLLNILTEENYQNILNKITNLILYKDNNLKDNEDIIKNEHIFKDIIMKKSFIENIFINLYAKLCNDLNNNIVNALIDKKNAKNNKERNLKFIINEECIIFLNKYKKISKEYNYIIDKASEDYISLRKKMIGYIIFVNELINLELLKQQFGYLILEQFYKKFTDNEVKTIFKELYLEACIALLNKLGKNIFDKNNKKLVQNINIFIHKNLISLIEENNNDNNIKIPSHIKYKIINIIKKKENSWKESLFELSQKETNKIHYEENVEKIDEIISNNKNIIINNNIDIKINESNKKDNNSLLIEEDLTNYISYFTEQGDKGQINIKNNVDKSYNWKVIDDLINGKNFGLEYIINKFIQKSTNIIQNEDQIVISNDYIKNIIEYYSNNLQKNVLDSIHNEMIKTFLNIDDYIKNNYLMSKILGNLLFILIENKLYHIKDFNNYLKTEEQTQINLAIITRYCIISAGKFAKKYLNDFKQTKLFLNNKIFKQYVTDALKDFLYFIK